MFYRIIDKGGIQNCLPWQRTCKVRSAKGLLVNVLGMTTVVFVYLIFYS
jgi:hypothetical protein